MKVASCVLRQALCSKVLPPMFPLLIQTHSPPRNSVGSDAFRVSMQLMDVSRPRPVVSLPRLGPGEHEKQLVPILIVSFAESQDDP
jgi:hypothetical protein